jgi:hypothetical protein
LTCRHRYTWFPGIDGNECRRRSGATPRSLPETEKHPYLLKGLVRCGGCGARYVGDSWHGRFYYRCSTRCKLLPAVRDYRLDNIVVDAVEALVTEHPATGRPLRQGDLKSLGTEERRELLRRLIQDAIFIGLTVTIRLQESGMAGGHNVTDLPSERPPIR